MAAAMDVGCMNNATLILESLGRALNSPVELTLYGRAALQLGFDNPLPDFAVSRDVDAVLFLGQAEKLSKETNFWEAVDIINKELSDQELYISHFFVEDQVVLRSDWRASRCLVPGDWDRLNLFRLGDGDLLLSKLMRDDPIDYHDARFIIERAGFTREDTQALLDSARVPDVPEIKEQFLLAAKKILSSFHSV
jgi:hypothetical protein